MKFMRIFVIATLIIFGSAYFVSFPQAAAKKKVPLEYVRCGDNYHRYAARLPVNYAELAKCPVLFCFDPAGDGAAIVRRFEWAADEFGWIIVGSLDVKNGSIKQIEKAQKATLKDVFKRYKVDRTGCYVAGFSEGARMAYDLAYTYPIMFKGVIAMGAGFGRKRISKRVAVYHCVGSKDSNRGEVIKAHTKLVKRHIQSKIEVFDGRHEYPGTSVLVRAVEWLNSINR